MRSSKDHAFGILMYHRVTAHAVGGSNPTWNVTPGRFRRQLEGLLKRGYQAWPLNRAVEYRKAGEPIPPHVFVVTFDDGYECVYREAWPILQELSVPATVFAVTSYFDAETPFSADDWALAGSKSVPESTWRPLSTRQCEEMLEQGLVEIGSHTHTHADFTGRPAAFREDLHTSFQTLFEKFNIARPSFAFPFGRYDEAMVAVIRELDATCSLTTEPQTVQTHADRFHWGRITAWEHDTASTLVWKLGCMYRRMRSAWKYACRFRIFGQSSAKARPTWIKKDVGHLPSPKEIVS